MYEGEHKRRAPTYAHELINAAVIGRVGDSTKLHTQLNSMVKTKKNRVPWGVSSFQAGVREFRWHEVLINELFIY